MGKPNAKARSLQVRPIQSADLSFEIAGILGKQSPNFERAKLGWRVTASDLSVLVPDFRKTVDGSPAKLFYNSANIFNALKDTALFSLRNDLLAASLDQSIFQREIAHLEKFLHKDKIVGAVEDVYSEKLNRLVDLKNKTNDHTAALKKAYEDTNYTQVVTETVTSTRHTGDTTSLTYLTPVALRNTPGRIETRDSPVNMNSNQNVAQTSVIPQAWDGGKWTDLENRPDTTFKSQKMVSANDLTQMSTTRNTEYRHPFLENLIQDQRAHLALQDETLLHKTFSFQVPLLTQIIDVESNVLDHEIRKSQIRFMQSFLLSPISGIVTAVYKDLGEAVQPGEPVLRVENDEKVLIVGLINCRQLLTVGRRVRITPKSLYEDKTQKVFEGPIISVRGHDSDDDEWDIMIECDNKDKALPINYNFDRDPESTLIEVI